MLQMPRWRGVPPAGFVVDCFGIKTRAEFETGLAAHVESYGRDPGIREPPLPAFSEETFEWVDVLEAVAAARERFVMIELGAGYGRWLVRGVAALRVLNPLPYALVGVEAEPTHFAWLREHLDDNGIGPDAHDLIQAAMHVSAGTAMFHVGNPAGWYGQALAKDDAPAPAPRRSGPVGFLLRKRRRAKRAAQRAATAASQSGPNGQRRQAVRTVTLTGILEQHARVDLIDLDIQGAELAVLRSAIEPLTATVRRLHIGTHSAAIEDGLRALFTAHGWTLRNDYACGTAAATPYGPITFGDGVQTWVNPRV